MKNLLFLTIALASLTQFTLAKRLAPSTKEVEESKVAEANFHKALDEKITCITNILNALMQAKNVGSRTFFSASNYKDLIKLLTEVNDFSDKSVQKSKELQRYSTIMY